MASPPAVTKLNAQVLLYPPTSPESNVISMHPSIVLLFGWMDARHPHLQKYVDSLQSTFPTSTVILIKSATAFFLTSEKQLEATLMPVVNVIRREVEAGPKFRGILIHVLSNGGGFQFLTLRKVLAKMPITDASFQPGHAPTALVLDSTPGNYGLQSCVNMMAPANPVIRILAIAPITLLYATFYVINTSLCGNPPVFQELREALGNSDVLPSVTNPADPKATPHLYIYSDADKITLSPNVAAHIAESKSKGFDVDVELFAGTSHVSHARSDPERYWGAVQKLWLKAVAAATGSALSPSL